MSAPLSAIKGLKDVMSKGTSGITRIGKMISEVESCPSDTLKMMLPEKQRDHFLLQFITVLSVIET